MKAVRQAGTELVPVDSEHSAAFQSIAGADPASHRAHRADGLRRAVPHLEPGGACARHATAGAAAIPTGRWGRKITINSATLMNKGLELIEAYHLFPVEPGQLEVVVHPQSIIHALVAYRDGSMLAQLASPDMRTPIALSLSWPSRMDGADQAARPGRNRDS